MGVFVSDVSCMLAGWVGLSGRGRQLWMGGAREDPLQVIRKNITTKIIKVAKKTLKKKTEYKKHNAHVQKVRKYTKVQDKNKKFFFAN